MPQKTLGERVRRAKRKGTPATLKRSDLRGPTARSAHGAKKSSQLAGQASPAGRHASRKAPPGEGISGGKVLREARAAAYEKRAEREARPRNRKGTRQKSGRRGTLPEGRKKAPSQAGVKRAGGPFKRTRLHGG